MDRQSILKETHQRLLDELIQKARIYNYWHINIPIGDLRNIVDKIEEIEKEII